MKKALFIVGPTAAGKTSLAVKINRKFSSVLINADSIQVYKNADIISGKDHPKNVKIFLIDIVLTNQSFSVRDFVENARTIINQAIIENKIPIIVGGTGFYIDSLFSKVKTIGVMPNARLRKKLQKVSVSDLQRKLEKINPVRFRLMNNSDLNNPRRLIRAIEVSFVPLSSQRDKNTRAVFLKNEVLVVGLKTSKDNLGERIEARIRLRIKKGALREAENLFGNYENLSKQIKAANGYKQLFEYLKGEISFEEAEARWVRAELMHAKNQITWFKRNKDIVWFDIQKPCFEEAILRLIEHNFSSV